MYQFPKTNANVMHCKHAPVKKYFLKCARDVAQCESTGLNH